MFEIKELIVFDCDVIERLREHDRREANFLYGAASYDEIESLALETLENAVEAFGIYIGGTLEGVFGVSKGLYEGVYTPWFFGTKVLEEIPGTTFARLSKRVVESWFDRYPCLVNTALYDEKVLRWLEWLGFHVDIHGFEDTIDEVMVFYRLSQKGV